MTLVPTYWLGIWMNQPTLEGRILGDCKIPLHDGELLKDAQDDFVLDTLGTLLVRPHTQLIACNVVY